MRLNKNDLDSVTKIQELIHKFDELGFDTKGYHCNITKSRTSVAFLLRIKSVRNYRKQFTIFVTKEKFGVVYFRNGANIHFKNDEFYIDEEALKLEIKQAIESENKLKTQRRALQFKFQILLPYIQGKMEDIGAEYVKEYFQEFPFHYNVDFKYKDYYISLHSTKVKYEKQLSEGLDTFRWNIELIEKKVYEDMKSPWAAINPFYIYSTKNKNLKLKNIEQVVEFLKSL